MNNSKIEWCDMTWNPVTGCLHGCPYCYARRIAERFGGRLDDGNKLHDLKIKSYRKDKQGKLRYDPFPFGFEPTFHRYRLDEPQRVRKPQTVFVCSMADLFGDWVPDEPCPWLDELNGAIEAALDKLATYENGVEQISERLKKELENKQFAHDDAGKIEYAGIVYGLRNALLMLGEGKRINAEAALQARNAAQ